MVILLCYFGITLLTSVISLYFFQKVYGNCTSIAEGALLSGVIWPITLTAMLLGWVFLILDATLKTCISIIKNKED